MIYDLEQLPKFGEKVNVTGKLQRSWTHKADRHFPQTASMKLWRIWEAKPITQREGIVIGFRTLYNGIKDWIGEEEGYCFIQMEHFKAALVVFNERENPVYCLLGDLRSIK
jgi:hypothetical protein